MHGGPRKALYERPEQGKVSWENAGFPRLDRWEREGTET